MPHLKEDRSIGLRDNEAGGDVDARREAILARARLDAERWVDDGGSFHAEAFLSTTSSPTAVGTPGDGEDLSILSAPAAGKRTRRMRRVTRWRQAAQAQTGYRAELSGDRPVLFGSQLENVVLMRSTNSHEAPILRRRPLIDQVIKRQRLMGPFKLRDGASPPVRRRTYVGDGSGI